ncbi:Lrp/AsnC family transcriptional regulator [uncultured Roseobacter sp.]|uniref:Lrp/AsnC family transcriptional regulator n=1 Tax=uncultured Roseobacter sp. TaxID=114847 RepID=UPI002607B314|nr:Lrp/AsnC family transcriptional regulator [uncultured Roseobacter sp.]
MEKETNRVRPFAGRGAALDEKDRTLLGLLSEDATLSYAELGNRIALSAPAVHERVKRLKRDGVIQGTIAKLDGASIGRPLLAFVHVDTLGWGAKGPFLEMDALPDVEEVHSVAGDTCLLLKVRCADAQALEKLLAKIYAMEGVQRTRSLIALSTYLERGPQARIGSAD